MISQNPQVSIIMSVFNGQTYLRESIQSIINQTFRNFEFIIIDDGSTDNSTKLIKSFPDPRIRLLINNENLGLIASLNKGIEMARGQYIARQDDDDISLPTRLEQEVKILDQHPTVGLVGTFFTIINENGVAVQNKILPSTSAHIKNTLKTKNCFAHGSIMLRKECFTKTAPYRKEFKHCEDFDLWLRISEHYECQNIPQYLYLWRLRTNSISVTNRLHQNILTALALQFQQERILKLKDPIEKGTWSPNALDKVINDNKINFKQATVESILFQGVSLLRNENVGEAVSTFASALKQSPVNPRTWFWIIMCGIKIILPKRIFDFLLNFFLSIAS